MQIVANWAQFQHLRLVDFNKLRRELSHPIDVDAFVSSVQTSCDNAEEHLISTFDFVSELNSNSVCYRQMVRSCT